MIIIDMCASGNLEVTVLMYFVFLTHTVIELGFELRRRLGYEKRERLPQPIRAVLL